MSRWVGTQGQVTSAKNARKPASVMTSPTKTTQNFLKFLKIETTKLSGRFEGLNSCLALAAGELWPEM